MHISKGVKIGLLLASLGAIAFVIVKRVKNAKTIKKLDDILAGKIPDPNNAAQTVISAAAQTALPDGAFPIAFGSSSKKVLAVQQLLMSKFQSPINASGLYDAQTWSAMCKNVWHSTFKIDAVACYEGTGVEGIKKSITQDDYTFLQNYVKSN